MNFCCGSFEKAMSQVDPSPSVFGETHASLTNLPSGVNTWIRSFDAIADVDQASFDISAQCTGVRNCCAGGASGL